MKTRLLPTAMLAAVGFALLAFAAACGGGDSQLSLEEYFDELEQLFDDFENVAGEAEATLDGAVEDAEDEDAEFELFRESLREGASLFASFRDDLGDLNAPDDVEDEHQDLVGAASGFVELLEDIVDDLADADDEFDLFSLLLDEDFNDNGDGFEEACLALQAIAEDSEITVDLRCGDEVDGDFDGFDLDDIDLEDFDFENPDDLDLLKELGLEEFLEDLDFEELLDELGLEEFDLDDSDADFDEDGE